MPALLSAKASYKKQGGTLELTHSHLQWTQDGLPTPSVSISLSDVANLFSSKQGAAQVRLKVALPNDDTGHNFTFTAPQPNVASTERDKFKTELTNIMMRNRGGAGAATPSTSAGPHASVASAVSQPRTPAQIAAAKTASSSRASSVSNERRPTPVVSGDPAADFRLRKTVLLSNPELAALHKELVMTGQISEADFWDGREHMLLAQAATEGQKRGRPGQIVDPRPQTVEGGDVKIIITPQLVHDIFEEYPVVARAYNENVPSKLTEGEFWKRYFQSKLFNAHRASIRSSAAQHVDKADPIFDKYLEKDDDELEPRRQREQASELYVNLGATQEDHAETGNEKDITMQAGRQRGALPLIRKFNEHSERLLNSALGDGPASKRRRLSSNGQEYSQIIIEDLRSEDDAAGIVLEMQERQRYFDSGGAEAAAAESIPQEPLNPRAMALEARDNLLSWESNLGQFTVGKKSAEAALLSMSQNVSQRLDIKARKNDMSASLYSQLTTCQTAANEFLRQFWTAMYPSAADHQQHSLAAPTPAQKAAKAQKMIGYLSKTHEKVEALVKMAQKEGVDPKKVQIAMQPVLNSVDRALTFYRNRKPSAPATVGAGGANR